MEYMNFWLAWLGVYSIFVVIRWIVVFMIPFVLLHRLIFGFKVKQDAYTKDLMYNIAEAVGEMQNEQSGILSERTDNEKIIISRNRIN